MTLTDPAGEGGRTFLAVHREQVIALAVEAALIGRQ